MSSSTNKENNPSYSKSGKMKILLGLNSTRNNPATYSSQRSVCSPAGSLFRSCDDSVGGLLDDKLVPRDLELEVPEDFNPRIPVELPILLFSTRGLDDLRRLAFGVRLGDGVDGGDDDFVGDAHTAEAVGGVVVVVEGVAVVIVDVVVVVAEVVVEVVVNTVGDDVVIVVADVDIVVVVGVVGVVVLVSVVAVVVVVVVIVVIGVVIVVSITNVVSDGEAACVSAILCADSDMDVANEGSV